MTGVEILAPRFPVINNIDVAVVSDPAAIKDALVRQAAGPVRWVESVQAMARDGGHPSVRVRPRQGFGGLTRRIDSTLTGTAVFDPASLAEALAAVR